MSESNSTPVAVLDTFNTPGWRGNGGDHRALQVAELLQRIGLVVRVPPVSVPTTLLERHLLGLRLLPARGYPMNLEPGVREREPTRGRQAISNAGHFAKRYLDVLAAPPRPRVFLWENSNNTLGAHLAEKQGCAIVAVPQNLYWIEAGGGPGRRHRVLADLDREVRFLRRCKAVFCISREEQWFLRLQGIDADFLPYYPPRQLEEFLLEIRRARRPLDERRFLVLGSATHGPTRRSLVEQIRVMSGLAGVLGFHVDVAGHGTEALRGEIPSASVVLHGTVSQEQLGQLLSTATAAVVHQRPSAGALTRIPEFLVAGVPVVANVDAGRSTWGYLGVTRYQALAELRGLLAAPFPSPPIPDRSVDAEDRFCSAVRALISPPAAPVDEASGGSRVKP